MRYGIFERRSAASAKKTAMRPKNLRYVGTNRRSGTGGAREARRSGRNNVPGAIDCGDMTFARQGNCVVGAVTIIAEIERDAIGHGIRTRVPAAGDLVIAHNGAVQQITCASSD
jgi:hypothetical protein